MAINVLNEMNFSRYVYLKSYIFKLKCLFMKQNQADRGFWQRRGENGEEKKTKD